MGLSLQRVWKGQAGRGDSVSFPHALLGGFLGEPSCSHVNSRSWSEISCLSQQIHSNCCSKGPKGQTLDLNQMGYFTPPVNPAGFDAPSFWADVQLSPGIVTVAGQGTVYA